MRNLFSSVFLSIIFLFIFSCNRAQNHERKANRLIHESSPYLLQHAYNPVDWYPWGTEAFEKAKKENKPVIVSIGYSSCHWCHVMEKESFEDDSVARFMNDNFVCIKVDREERPDVDQIYIEAAQMMNGSAGWPLNCITLSDGKPFFAGTYFPKTQWMTLLEKVQEIWAADKDKITQQANLVANGIAENSMFQPADGQPIDASLLVPAAKQLLSMYDKKEGGYSGAPKFPMPANLEALLTLYKLTDNQEALDIARLTLTKMGHGGIYDQISGGFARYATDGYWKVPHFEKMLYDNGQLLSVYAKAYQVTKDPLYKRIVDETITFMQRELLAEDGGFYSSLDADSEGEEGLFYVWKKSELEEALGDNVQVVMDYYQVSQNGNWEHGKNILLPMENLEPILKKYELTEEELQKIIMDSKGFLLAKRAERVRPGLDDKILTSWNGLAIIGLADAYRTFQDDSYLKLATNAANFLSEKMMQDDFRLDRNYKNGKSSINGFLDDYAFTIAAFIQMYQVTFDEYWLEKSKSLTDYVIAHFSDPESSYFFYTSDLDPALIARKIDNADNVIPSANSQMAMNLHLLGNYFYDEEYLKKSENMVNGISGYFGEHIGSFVNWFHLYMLKTHDFYEIAIVGEDYLSLRSEMEQHFLPNAIFMGGVDEGNLELLEDKLISGKTRIYVCKEKMCKLPVTEVSAALLQMENP